jgi:uncharacterized delta-60 repeat protein
MIRVVFFLLVTGCSIVSNLVFAQTVELFSDVVYYGTPNVYSFSETKSGDYLVGGLMDHVNGTFTGSLAKLSGATGAVDPSFRPLLADNYIMDTRELPDGRILVSGYFKKLDGRAGSLFRLHPDGTIDESFTPYPSEIWSLALQSDGKILAATATGLIRLHPAGALDTSYQVAMYNGIGILLDEQDNAYVTTSTSLYKFDVNGLPVDGFPVVTNGYFFESLKHENKIVIAGNFTSVDSVGRHGIAIINPDGSLDPFNLNLGMDVERLLFQKNGAMIAANLNSVRAYDKQGNALSYVANSGINSMFVDSKDRILITGGYMLKDGNGTTRPFAFRLNADLSVDTAYKGELSRTLGPTTIVPYPNGKILLAADFQSLGIGPDRKRLVRLNRNGTLDSLFDAKIGSNAVMSAALQHDGKILVYSADSVRRLNPSGEIDKSFSGLSSFNSLIAQLKTVNDHVYVGGYFNEMKGFSSPGIVRLKVDGSIDQTFKSGLPANLPYVAGFEFLSDGDIIVIGGIRIDGQFYTVIRLNSDGSIDQTFTKGTNEANGVWEVHIDSKDRIYLSGDLYHFAGTEISRLVRLTPQGKIDSLFLPTLPFEPNANIHLALVSDNEVVVGANNFTGGKSLMVYDENGIPLDASYTTYSQDYSSISRLVFDGTTLFIGGRLVAPDRTKVSAIGRVSMHTVIGSITALSATRLDNNRAQLKWTNDHSHALAIVIERSPMDENSFEEITSLGSSTVEFIDSLIDGKPYYYRVKAINSSSETEYSAVENVEGVITAVDERQVAALSIFPNPGHGVFQVTVPQQFVGGKLSVIGSNGNVIKNHSATIVDTSVIVDMTGASAGLYVFRMMNNGETMSAKIINR